MKEYCLRLKITNSGLGGFSKLETAGCTIKLDRKIFENYLEQNSPYLEDKIDSP